MPERLVVEAEDFGLAQGASAAANAAAIESAIAEFRFNAYLPVQGNIKEPFGGTVLLPEGKFNCDKVRVPGGVTVRGAGRRSTSLVSADDSVIEFYDHAGHEGFCINPALEEFAINNSGGHGVTVDQDSIGTWPTTINILSPRISKMLISASGWAMNFGKLDDIGTTGLGSYVLNGNFDDICIEWSGAGLLYLEGDVNTIRKFNHKGGSRAGFDIGDLGLIDVAGNGNQFLQNLIEAFNVAVLAYHIKGDGFTYIGSYAENATAPNNIQYLFEDCETGFISHLQLLPFASHAKFKNCRGISIANLNLDGDSQQLKHAVEFEGLCGVDIGNVFSRNDCGSLDSDVVTIGRNWNKIGGYSVPGTLWRPPPGAPNLLSGKSISSAYGWNLDLGVVSGRPTVAMTTEVKPDRTGRRLKIVISANAANRVVKLLPTFSLPGQYVGSKAYLDVKLSTNIATPTSDAVVYHHINGGGGGSVDLSLRARETLTRARITTALSADDTFEIRLPPDVGTWYVSDAALTPVV